MRTKHFFFYLVISLSVAACGGGKSATESSAETKAETAQESAESKLANQMMLSTLWMQYSAEAELLREQAYEYAWMLLQNKLQDIELTKQPAVVLDIDETVLDNSAYQARLIREGEQFSPSSWHNWVKQAQADLVPGAREFIKKAVSQDIIVFYISNRDEELLEPTLENLGRHELPNLDDTYILLKSNSSDKTSRREEVLAEHQVLLYIGDQLTDFTEEYQGYLKEPDLRRKLLNEFVILPNPLYGNFESEIYDQDGDMDLSPEQKLELRKAALYGKDW